MATRDELLEMDGVVAAGEFAPDGTLVDWAARMDMSPEMDERIVDLAPPTAKLCAEVTEMFNTRFGAFSGESGMTWTPQRGWLYCGGDWMVVIGGHRGVFAETAKVDMSRLCGALFGH